MESYNCANIVDGKLTMLKLYADDPRETTDASRNVLESPY